MNTPHNIKWPEKEDQNGVVPDWCYPLLPPSFPEGGDNTIKKQSPLSRQEGGSHYKKYAIQPVEYAMANNLNYCQANAIKYVTRYKDKGGIEDLRKAIHNLEILIELEERGGKLG